MKQGNETMQPTTKIVVTVMTFCLALTAYAGQRVDQRGYLSCVGRIEKDLDKQVPKISSVYFMTTADESRTYYINGTVWQDGHRQPVRSECVTSRAGHRVLTIMTESGRFNTATAGRIDIDTASVQ